MIFAAVQQKAWVRLPLVLQTKKDLIWIERIVDIINKKFILLTTSYEVFTNFYFKIFYLKR